MSRHLGTECIYEYHRTLSGPKLRSKVIIMMANNMAKHMTMSNQAKSHYLKEHLQHRK